MELPDSFWRNQMTLAFLIQTVELNVICI